jgi:hypothetical protein
MNKAETGAESIEHAIPTLPEALLHLLFARDVALTGGKANYAEILE